MHKTLLYKIKLPMKLDWVDFQMDDWLAVWMAGWLDDWMGDWMSGLMDV